MKNHVVMILEDDLYHYQKMKMRDGNEVNIKI